MKCIIFLCLALVAISVASGEQQRILRRVIKSTPTATNLSRVRVVTARASGAEKGAVSEISSKEAANFGQRSVNETAGLQQRQQQQQQQATKTKQASSTQAPVETTTASVSTTAASLSTLAPAAPTSTSTPATTTTTSTTTTARAQPKSSDRQQSAPQQGEVELLSSAPSSWQTMTAVEAPAAALIAAGTRPAQQDLSSSSSDDSSYISSGAGDFLRSSGIKGGLSSSSQSVGETFSRLRQQSSTRKSTQQQQQQVQQQSFFYPQQQRAQSSKTSNYQSTKTHWYQPSTTTTTPRPAPIIQEEQQQEQQYEQYVEQQVEGAAPPGQAEPFAFDFKTQDQSGNGQYRKEESDKNGVVRGSYGYWSDGIYRQVNYIADENGFRASIQSNEPGMKKDAEAPASIELRS